MELKGFARVSLEPGEQKTVTMTLTPKELCILNRNYEWEVEPGTFTAMIGRNAGDILLSTDFAVAE